MLIPVTPALAERAAAGLGDAPPTHDAATIVLLRPGRDGPETYLLRRQSTMAFAPGHYVFPGGKVQESDHEVLEWVGRPSSWWGERFGCEADTARALVVAAVRETFEESGILLAGHDGERVVADTSQDWAQQGRVDLEAGQLSFADFLGGRDLVLRADLLGAWAHWITPAFEPRRYDTRFLVATVPQGQRVGSLPGEADQATWAPLRAALAAVEAGEAAMMAPTLVTCRELVDVALENVLDAAAARRIGPIEPRLVEVDGELYLDSSINEERA